MALDSAEDIVSGDVDAPDEEGLLPDLPMPEGAPPLGELSPFGEEVPHLPEGVLPRGCLPEGLEKAFPELPDLPGVEPADVPAPGYLPAGWQITGVMTNRIDGAKDDVMYEVGLTNGDDRMTITLGNGARLDDRIAEVTEGGDAEETEVSGAPAAVIEDGERRYLVFEREDMDGLIDAPSSLEASELVRIAESIR